MIQTEPSWGQVCVETVCVTAFSFALTVAGYMVFEVWLPQLLRAIAAGFCA